MLLIDQRATIVAPSSVFLTRAEFKELYPHKLNGRINYVFKYNRPKEVNNGEAKLLLKKYSHIIKWEKIIKLGATERHEELNKVLYQDLKKLAAEVGVSFKDSAVKQTLLIDRIIAKEIEIAKTERENK